MVEYIYYTGIGSKKNGKHTIKEFLSIMNKNFNIECSKFLPKLTYKTSSEYKDMKTKTIKNKKCKLDEYIKFVGAIKSKSKSKSKSKKTCKNLKKYHK